MRGDVGRLSEAEFRLQDTRFSFVAISRGRNRGGQPVAGTGWLTRSLRRRSHRRQSRPYLMLVDQTLHPPPDEAPAWWQRTGGVFGWRRILLRVIPLLSHRTLSVRRLLSVPVGGPGSTRGTFSRTPTPPKTPSLISLRDSTSTNTSTTKSVSAAYPPLAQWLFRGSRRTCSTWKLSRVLGRGPCNFAGRVAGCSDERGNHRQRALIYAIPPAGVVGVLRCTAHFDVFAVAAVTAATASLLASDDTV